MRFLHEVAQRSARAATVLRDEGPRIFLLKLASECGYRRLVLLHRAIADPIPDARVDPGVEFALLGADGVDAYCAFRPDAQRERIEARWRAGRQCFVAREGGRIVASCWIAERDAATDYLQCAIDLEPGAAYLFDAFTHPAARGRGIARALCMHQLRHLQRAGFRLAVRATAAQNRTALRLHLSCGFRPVGGITRLRIGPWTRLRRQGPTGRIAPIAAGVAPE